MIRPASLALEQQRRRRAHAVERAAQVDVFIVRSHCSSVNRISRPLIATPALLTRMSSEPWSLPIALIASVTAALFATSNPATAAVPPACLDRGGGLARRRLARGVVDDHLGAAPAERDRDRASDAARTAGDERDFAVQCLDR